MRPDSSGCLDSNAVDAAPTVYLSLGMGLFGDVAGDLLAGDHPKVGYVGP
jgi:hypothetical protein